MLSLVSVQVAKRFQRLIVKQICLVAVGLASMGIDFLIFFHSTRNRTLITKYANLHI